MNSTMLVPTYSDRSYLFKHDIFSQLLFYDGCRDYYHAMPCHCIPQHAIIAITAITAITAIVDILMVVVQMLDSHRVDQVDMANKEH